MGQEENEIINRIPSKYDVIYHPSIKVGHIVSLKRQLKHGF